MHKKHWTKFMGETKKKMIILKITYKKTSDLNPASL